jgi:hypothetical protein
MLFDSKANIFFSMQINMKLLSLSEIFIFNWWKISYQNFKQSNKSFINRQVTTTIDKNYYSPGFSNG